MSKMKLKIDQLAKLRQFTVGMDPSQFLATEFRQVIKALEQAYVDTSSGSSKVTIFNGSTIFYASIPGNTSGTVPIDSSNSKIVNDAGRLSGGIFYPAEQGTYFVEAACEMDFYNIVPLGSPTSSYLRAYYSTGSLAGDTKTTVLDSAGNFNTYIGNFPPLGIFMDLSPSLGVYFTMNPGSSTTLSRFYCKVTKVS